MIHLLSMFGSLALMLIIGWGMWRANDPRNLISLMSLFMLLFLLGVFVCAFQAHFHYPPPASFLGRAILRFHGGYFEVLAMCISLFGALFLFGRKGKKRD